MAQHYSNPKRAKDPHSLPNVETFQLTAAEVAERDEDTIHEMMKRREFRLAAMNTRTREAMIEAMIEEQGIEGGWFYWFCLPGCLPDSEPMGPFKTQAEALADARENAGDDDDEEGDDDEE